MLWKILNHFLFFGFFSFHYNFILYMHVQIFTHYFYLKWGIIDSTEKQQHNLSSITPSSVEISSIILYHSILGLFSLFALQFVDYNIGLQYSLFFLSSLSLRRSASSQSLWSACSSPRWKTLITHSKLIIILMNVFHRTRWYLCTVVLYNLHKQTKTHHTWCKQTNDDRF